MALDTTVSGSDSDSYATLAEFKAYADAIGFDYSGSADAALEIALRKGARYLDRAYRGRWKGFRTDGTQALAWPRTADERMATNYLTPAFTVGVVDEDGYELAANAVPQRVKDAQCEATILILGGTDPLSTLTRGGMVHSEEVSAGPVSSKTTWRAGAPGGDRYRQIEGLLSGLVNSHPNAGVGSARIMRG